MVDKQQPPQQVSLKIPANTEDLTGLEPGTVVYLDGVIYTGREGVYKKVISDAEPLPLDLPAVSNANFHCSPAAARGQEGLGANVNSTATASFRFSQWMPQWFEKSGARIIIGKGGMSAADYKNLFVPVGAI